MNRFLYIYLAGNIKKGKEEEEDEAWSESNMEELRGEVEDCSLVFLNPAYRLDDLSNQKSVFGRDLFQVYSSDLVLVDARGKRGLGVGAEMMFAKMHRIPVVAWVPYPSHYSRESLHLLGQDIRPWIHPFVFGLCDYVAPSLAEAAKWINGSLVREKAKIKGPEYIKESMNYYLESQLERDTVMQNLVSSGDMKSRAEVCRG